jgi:putative tricarboxylic transport membrane protein
MSSSPVRDAKGELVFTGSLLVLSLLVLYNSFILVEGGINAIVGPRAFAVGVGVFMTILTSLQFIAVLRGDRGVPDSIEGGELKEKNNWKALLIVIGGILFHIFSIETIGFIAGTIPMFLAVAYALGDRKWIRMVIVATVMTVTTFFTFTEFLQLNLPVGFDFIFGDNEIDEEW